MFWDKGYTPSQNIEALLQKEDVTLGELLDDEDILQECKTQSRSLVQYLTRPDIIKQLVEYIITEPPQHLSVAQRFKHSNTACEILTFGLPSLDQRLVEEPTILQKLYSFLEQEPPLNPLVSSFFTKTFITLISKKSEQDWFLYQKMCLQVLEFIKSQNNFLDLLFKHFATPVIMDLLLQIIREVQGGNLKKDLYEWLAEQKLVERLIQMLGDPKEREKHNNIAEFLCDLMRHGRTMRQSEQENDSFEPVFIGSNPLLQILESDNLVSLLLDAILKKPIVESSIIAGVSVILTLVDKSIVDEPASDTALQIIIDREKENHENIVYTVIQAITPRIAQFHELLLNPPEKNDIITTVGKLSPPFGVTRLQICRLFTVLLQTGCENVINAISTTEFFNTLLKLFKQYVWNNFLHSEVEKCLSYVFTTFDQNDNDLEIKPSALQTHVIISCKIVGKLIDCWMHNKTMQSFTNGRRLGYMGHLIQILQNVNSCALKSNQIGALIESSLNEEEIEVWKMMIEAQNGELINELVNQNRFLADCDPSQSSNGCEASMQMDFHKLPDLIIESPSQFDPFLDEVELGINDINLNAFSDMDENTNMRDIDSNPLNMSISPWGPHTFTSHPVDDNSSKDWDVDFSSSNFADFDAHFNTFSSDMGDTVEMSKFPDSSELIVKSDTNANVKPSIDNGCEVIMKNYKNLDLVSCTETTLFPPDENFDILSSTDDNSFPHCIENVKEDSIDNSSSNFTSEVEEEHRFNDESCLENRAIIPDEAETNKTCVNDEDSNITVNDNLDSDAISKPEVDIKYDEAKSEEVVDNAANIVTNATVTTETDPNTLNTATETTITLIPETTTTIETITIAASASVPESEAVAATNPTSPAISPPTTAAATATQATTVLQNGPV